MPEKTGGSGGVANAVIDQNSYNIMESLGTDYLNITGQHGQVSFDAHGALHNLAKPANDGHGVVYGSGHGNVIFLLGAGGVMGIAYGDGGGQVVSDNGTPTVNSTGTLTEFTVVGASVASTKMIHQAGCWTVEDNVGFRIQYIRQSDGAVLAETCDDGAWAGDVGHGYGVIGYTSANAYASTPMAHAWSLSPFDVIDIKYEFKSAVTLVGSGIWGSTWVPGLQETAEVLTGAAIVYYDLWAAKTYAANDKIVEDGVIYRCNTAGAQVGTFAANSSLWTEVGNIPSVMTYKGGITVADFNALTVGNPGDFYRIADAGTLTGGQATAVGDQVVVNTALTGTILAAEFDYFPNQESGVVIPPWSAKTYVLDEAIYEGGEIYYCASAGAQITSFATNVASWDHWPRIDASLKADADNTYDLGSTSKGMRRLYTKKGVYYDVSGRARLELSATDTRVLSPDGNVFIAVNDTDMHFVGATTVRPAVGQTVNLGGSAQPWDGVYFNGDLKGSASAALNDGSRNRILWDAAQLKTVSPDGTVHTVITNTEHTNTGKVVNTLSTKLGTSAPAITMKKVTGTMPGTNSANTTAHGITDIDKIIGIEALVQTDNGSWTDFGIKGRITGHDADYVISATDIQIWTSSGNSSSIDGNAFKFLFTLED